MVASASRWYRLVTIAALVPLAGCGDRITDPASEPASGSRISAFSATGIAAVGRAGHVAAALPNGRVLVAGGTNGNTRLASAELFDPATRSWSVGSGMAYPRLGHAAVSLADGRVLVVGGHSQVSACATTAVSRSAEIYDPGSGAWAPAADMTAPRNSPAAVLLADGRVLVAGGGDRCGGVFRSAEIFNPATGTWARTGDLNVPRQAAAPVRLSDGRVLVAGGVGSSPTWPALASAEVYDPATGTWTLTANMNDARLWGSVDVSASEVLALLADGRVLAAGGFDSCWQVCGFVLHSSAEVFDPATQMWTPVGPLSVARSNHRLSRLPTGHVLVAGGQAGSAVLGDAEAFDPASGTFVSAGALVAARYDHSATPLADGRVLIAQGQGLGGTLASAEIFEANLMTPPQQLTAMIGRLQAMADAGVLRAEDARTLGNKLSLAMELLDSGKSEPALNQLRAFIVMVQARVAAGRVPREVGEDLISEARQVMAAVTAA